MKKEKNNTNELKLKFFTKLRISIINFEHYHIIAADGPKNAIYYLLKLMLIFTIILTCFLTFKINITIKSLVNYTKSNIPNFSISDNQFKIDSDKPIIISNNDSMKLKIVMTNDDNSEQYIENEENEQDNLIVIAKNDVLIKNGYSGLIKRSYKDLNEVININGIDKNKVISNLLNNNLIILVYIYVFIGIFLMYFMSTLIDILALSLVGYFIARSIGLPLKYSSIFAMATSAMSLPIILILLYIIVNVSTGFTIPNFQVMYTIISYIYLITSIFIMRSNLLKKNINVTKEIKNKSIKNSENTDGADQE